jgi:hypothetical protein
MAEIGQNSHLAIPTSDDVTDGFDRIVRERESSNFKSLPLKSLPTFKGDPAGRLADFFLHHPSGQGRRDEWNLALSEKDIEPPDVVAMLVSEEDSREVLRIDAEGFEAEIELLGTEAGVNEEVFAIAFHDGGISATATA